MGGCFSQKTSDSEAMSAEIDGSTAGEPTAVNDLVHNGAGKVPVQGGSSEFVGASMRSDTAQKNTVEPMAPVTNNQTVQPLPYVTTDVYPNRSKIILDVPAENAVKTSVDQPRNPIFEDQPMVQQTVYGQAIKEQPATLPVRYNWTEKTLPPVTTAVQHDYQNCYEPVFEVPLAATSKTIVDKPVYQPFEEHPMVERTLHDQNMEEQPMIEQTPRSQIYEEQAARHTSSGDHAVLPSQTFEIQDSGKVKENFQVAKTQQPAHDRGVVFEGRTYRTRIFDPNLNEYVYVRRDDLQPRGGLMM